MPEKTSISYVVLILVFLLVATVTVLLSKNSVEREITVDVFQAVNNLATVQLSVQDYDVFVDDSRVQQDSYIWGLFTRTSEESFWYLHTRSAIAEVDFSEVAETSVWESNDTLCIVLPQPTVRLDSTGTDFPRVYWFTDIDSDKREIAREYLRVKADSVLSIQVSEGSAQLMQNARVQAKELVLTLVGPLHQGPISVSFNQSIQELQIE